MTDQRLDQLGSAAYQHTLSLLASEEMSDWEKEGIATRVETAFRNAVTSGDPMTCPECGDDVDEPGLCPNCEWACNNHEFDDGQPTEIDEWESFDPDC